MAAEIITSTTPPPKFEGATEGTALHKVSLRFARDLLRAYSGAISRGELEVPGGQFLELGTLLSILENDCAALDKVPHENDG